MVINLVVFSPCCDSDYTVFYPVKSPEYKLTGAKEIKALHKHTQITTWLGTLCTEKYRILLTILHEKSVSLKVIHCTSHSPYTKNTMKTVTDSLRLTGPFILLKSWSVEIFDKHASLAYDWSKRFKMIKSINTSNCIKFCTSQRNITKLPASGQLIIWV